MMNSPIAAGYAMATDTDRRRAGRVTNGDKSSRSRRLICHHAEGAAKLICQAKKLDKVCRKPDNRLMVSGSLEAIRRPGNPAKATFKGFLCIL